MNDELNYADKLIQKLKEIPEVYIYPTYNKTLYDIEAEEVNEIEAEQFGDVRFKPSKEELVKLHREFNKEVRVNNYNFAHSLTYIKDLHNDFNPIYEDKIALHITGAYNLRNGIKIFYDYHPEANPDPLEKLDILPKETLDEVQEYCQFQKNMIHEILRCLSGLIPEDLEIDNLDEPVKDENDTRIFINLKPEKIRNYFSFLVQETNTSQKIMRGEDLDYFLNKNFQGFPNASTTRNLTFELIAASHLQYIIYTFYRKNADLKEYKRERWAQLLKDTFPTKFNGNLKVIGSNFKKNDSVFHKFDELGLDLPE